MTTYATSLSTISGYLLSQIRNRMNLNQRDMARLFDMTQGAYGNMERGDANINAEFIFMLCSLVGLKASDFFGLLEEIMQDFYIRDIDERGNNRYIQIVTSSELNDISMAHKVFKALTDREGISESELEYLRNDLLKKTKGKTVLTAEEIENFLPDEIISKIAILGKTRLSKDEIKELVNIKSAELEKTNQGVNVSSSVGGLGAAPILGAAVAGPLGFLVGSLFKSYKESKEDKKK